MRGKLVVAGLCGCLAAGPAVALAAAPAATNPDPTATLTGAPAFADGATLASTQADPAALTSSVEGKLRAQAAQRLRTAVRTAVHKQAAARQRADAASAQNVAVPGVLQAIAQCESSGNPSARSGPYGGLFQFDQQTWASVGGTGDPAAASPAEQEQRAAMLYAQRGTQAWPVCGAGK